MSDALSGLPRSEDPDLLVGFETSDDASVYRLTDEIAVISTADFITPPVDDPWWFGQIAAANAISDVYSMGGRPTTALNLVMFPAGQLDMGVLREILRGGFEKVAEAGASVAGGHTIDDEEPKYGLSVDGVVHPDRVITNAGGALGDALILTKPIGAGVIFNAVRAGKMALSDVVDETLPTIAGLNGAAMAIALGFELHAATDITGFGVVGHMLEVALGCGARVVLDAGALPVYPGALEMYGKGVTTGSNAGNRLMCEGRLALRGSRDASAEELLFDPQTSGGLLLAVPGAQAAALLTALRAGGVQHAAQVGELVEGAPGVTVR